MGKKKFLIINIFFLFIFILLISLFYYLLYFLPLKNNNELFPRISEMKTRNNFDNVGKKIEISDDTINRFGINLGNLSTIKKNIFFIDGREYEEFVNAHIDGAENLRTPDIVNYNSIIKLFNLDKNVFDKSFFVVYCHDGRRSSDVVSRLDLDNVKFLIDGIDVFFGPDDNIVSFVASGIPSIENEIRNKDFIVNIDSVFKLSEKEDTFFIDGRLYKKNIDNIGYDFRISSLTTGDYNNKINKILDFKNSNLVYIADTYTDLFYAKLLIQRLKNNHGFDPDKFYVLFNQSEEFSKMKN